MARPISHEAARAGETSRFGSLLAELRERFEFATAAADIGFWFCDLPARELIWDERLKRHFWLEPDARVDIDIFYQRLHPEDRERIRIAIEESIASRTPYDVEYRTVSDSGETKWIHAIGRTAYDGAGRPVTFDGITQDVTQLARAREALEAERQRMFALFENVPIGLVFADATGRIVSGNKQAERIFGHPILFSPDIRSHGDWNGFHADGRPVKGHEYPLPRALNDGGTYRGEYLYRQPDRSLRWIELIAAPVLDGDGKIVGGVVSVTDIDVRKRTEEALLRNEKLAVVGRLASTISHEINNPLESVTNLLYLIEQNTMEHDSRAYAHMAQQELARVSHIVTHTLRFNRQTNAPGWERVSVLLESALAIYEPRIRSSGSVVKREYTTDDQVFCLASELRQVFANLIGNAFDAARTGGARVIVRTRSGEVNGRRFVRVTVADTGSGMDLETRQRLFEPFFTTKGESGTGLGLWVTREILAKHRAGIRVKSSQSEGHSGTVFSIWLQVDPVPSIDG